MAPDGSVSTGRALLRAISFGIDLHGVQMIGEGTNTSEDDGHGITPEVVRLTVRVSRYQRKNRCFKSFLSQLVSGDVPEDTLEVHGIGRTALQARVGDVTTTRSSLRNLA
jgi:hypothetical protein